MEGAALEIEVAASEPSNWLVTLDETWTLVTDEKGRAVFAGVPAGAHRVSLRRGAATASREVVTTDTGARLRVDIPAGSTGGR